MIQHKPQTSFLSESEVIEKSQWLPITLILLLATSLYFYQIGTESFWIDELYSVHDAKAITSNLNSTRPVYFLLLHFWMIFGSSDIWLRSLSVLLSLGGIFLIYVLGCRVADKPTGLLAALLMTLSPIFINHAQEVRMYALSNFLGLAGTLALVALMEKFTPVSLIGWSSARILAFLTAQLNILLLLPDCCLLMWKLRRQRRLWLTLGGVFLFLAIVSLPWTWNMVNASLAYFDEWGTSQNRPGLTQILSRLTIYTAYWPLQSLNSGVSMHFYKLYTVMLLGLLSFGLLIRWRSSKLLWIATWTFLPTAAVLIFSWLVQPIWLPRYLLFVAPYLLILLSAGFIQVWRSQRKLAFILAFIYLVAVGGGLEHYYTKVYREDWRGVAQLISANEEPGDVIALDLHFRRSQIALTHYYNGSSPIYVLENGEFSQLPKPQSRLWLVHLDPSDKVGEFETVVRNEFEVEKHQTFKNEIGWELSINVFLATPKPTTLTPS